MTLSRSDELQPPGYVANPTESKTRLTIIIIIIIIVIIIINYYY